MTPTFASVLFVIATLGAAQQQGQGQQGQQQGQTQQGQGQQGQGRQGQGQQGQGQQGQARQGQGQQGQGRQGQNVQGQAGQQGQQLTQNIAMRLGIRIATPTYFQDGRTGGATSTRPLNGPTPQSESFTVYPSAGKTLCESSSASVAMPVNAGFGWRVTITPRGLNVTITPGSLNASNIAVDLTWQRLWNNGQKVNEPVHGPVPLTLAAGGRVVLDYLSATPTATCQAVGMALEIGADSGPTTSLLQTDLWLVYQPDGEPARSQRQTVRVGENGSAMYYFDDVAIGVGTAIRYSGSLSKVAVKDGEVTMDLTIGQSAAGKGDRGGSTTYAVRAKLGDTIAFKLPNPMAQFFFFNDASKTTTTNVPASGSMSLLLRADQIR